MHLMLLAMYVTSYHTCMHLRLLEPSLNELVHLHLLIYPDIIINTLYIDIHTYVSPNIASSSSTV